MPCRHTNSPFQCIYIKVKTRFLESVRLVNSFGAGEYDLKNIIKSLCFTSFVKKKWTSGTCGGGGGGGVSAPIAPPLPMGLLFKGDTSRSSEEEFTYAAFVSSCCIKIETKMAV